VTALLKAPFPYFGGKSAVADIVWRRIGQPDHYIEPFFGSGAVLLARPYWTSEAEYTETVNDKDGFVANVWRGIRFDPDEVAKWCDWPVNHADLAARKLHLIRHEDYLLENLKSDPKWFDAELAGYWIWAASCWIGSGLTKIGQRPDVGSKGMGVHKVSLGQRPHLADKGRGVHKVSLGKIPHLGDKGMGVHKVSLGKRPHLGDKGMGVHKVSYKNNIYEWFGSLAKRLRRVRVVCGEWHRVCGGDWQDCTWKTVGMFFDPPYGVNDRAKVYHHDSADVAGDVLAWCAERGQRDNYRIVIAGYEEYRSLVSDHGWTSENWKARGGYANTGNNRGQENREREMLYFSPACVREQRQVSLFQSLPN
jgi:site-specific DNA-adenine methylase